MLNTCIIVGKVLETQKEDKGEGYIVVETERPFRDTAGTAGSDRFYITLWRGASQQCRDLCKEGDIIAVRGRIESIMKEIDGKIFYQYQVIGEKISFPYHS